ncbi:MAG TPA: gephyrin-like molybdotransferase Glp, partial [Alphaproteobacteria bacterium]|nr:gephyrin-like molybdotransferase Glp [Alphaproteobacteria bacterium]
DALRRVLAHAEPLSPENVPLDDANGRVLARDLTALRTQPPADVSAMDGYAVRTADVADAPVYLKVIGEVAAGRPFTAAVGPGETARIFTGGVIPAGADTIVVQESANREADRVEVLKPATKGRHIRKEGLDFRRGESLFAKGHRLTARDLALLAGMNHPLVTLHRRPKIALFATGDELVPPGDEPGPGQIVYSNGFALAALARQEGAVVSDLGLVGDTIEATIAAIRRARDIPTDILVTTGGASVGDYDFVHKAFAAEGMDLSFWKVAMRPGRPLMHGRLGDMHILGLPGNPVSSYVCAFLFLIPLIRRMSGRTDLTIPVESAVLGCDLPANDEREDYLRASLRHGATGKVATPFPIQDSSMMVSLARADCLIIREPYAPPASAGSRCAIVKFEH